MCRGDDLAIHVYWRVARARQQVRHLEANMSQRFRTTEPQVYYWTVFTTTVPVQVNVHKSTIHDRNGAKHCPFFAMHPCALARAFNGHEVSTTL